MSDEDTMTDDAVTETDADETATPPSAETERDKAFAEQRRKTRAAEKRAKDLEAKLAAKERADKEAEGRWEEIAKAAEKRAEDLERAVAARDKREAITAAATRLKFKNPALAHKLLDDDDIADEQTAERALTSLAKAEPYLLQDAPSRTGMSAVGGADESGIDDPELEYATHLRDAIQEMRSR